MDEPSTQILILIQQNYLHDKDYCIDLKEVAS